MIFFPTIVFFILGLIIGSFLNVVICRFNTQGSFWRSFGGRSACMSCNNKLCWYELIPLVSFLGLSGRCRKCKTKISIQYPLVEMVTGFIFAMLFLKFQGVLFQNILTFTTLYVYYAIMFSILVVIAVYDFRHKIIPDILSFVFGTMALIGLFFFYTTAGEQAEGVFYPHLPTLLEFFSGFFVATPFALLWLVSRGAWMGLGDAKLALGLGWFLGFWPAFSAVVVAFWTGAVVGLSLIVVSKIHRSYESYGMKSEIPFALYLALGAFLVFIFDWRLFQISF